MPKISRIPVKGGKKRANFTPSMSRTSEDSSIVRYHVLSASQNSDMAGGGLYYRPYIPAFTSTPSSGTGLIGATGPAIVSYYSSGKFLPGTTIKWCPNVSFSTSGRVYVGFTDNVEVCTQINGFAATYAAGGGTAAAALLSYINGVIALGSVVSFPVWEETMVNFPSRLRRKWYDTNVNVVLSDTNVLDRCQQTCMYAAFVGVNTGSIIGLGNFEMHDVVAVEGITNIAS